MAPLKQPKIPPGLMARAYHRGASLSIIAAKAGIHKKTVKRWLVLLGVKIRPKGGDNRWPKKRAARNKEILRLYYGDLLPMAAIAEKVGMSPAGVHTVLQRDGWGTRPRGWNGRQAAAALWDKRRAEAERQKTMRKEPRVDPLRFDEPIGPGDVPGAVG